MTLLQQILDWQRSGEKDETIAKSIILRHSEAMPIRIRQKLEAGTMHFAILKDTLNHWMEQVRLQCARDEALARAPMHVYQTHNTVAVPAKDSMMPRKSDQVTYGIPSPQPVPIPKAPPVKFARTDMNAVTKRISQLGSRRAILSNQLRIDDGNPAIIKKNIEILGKLKGIMADMAIAEEQKKDLMQGKPLVDPAQAAGWVVDRKSEKYTLQELKMLSLDELKKLRKRLSLDISKCKSRLARKDALRGRTRLNNEEKLAQRNREHDMVKLHIEKKRKQ